MTAVIGPRCLCTHSAWRHLGDTDRCRATGCVCRAFRDAADELGEAIARHPAKGFTAAELATLHRFENTRPAPESWRGEEDDQ